MLVSDGVDRYSTTSASDVVAHAKTRDVLVFPVAVATEAPTLFWTLAAETGGRAFVVRDPGRLSETLQTVSADLHAQYLLGYVPSRPAGGSPEWRTLRVRVRRAALSARARPGYWTLPIR